MSREKFEDWYLAAYKSQPEIAAMVKEIMFTAWKAGRKSAISDSVGKLCELHDIGAIKCAEIVAEVDV